MLSFLTRPKEPVKQEPSPFQTSGEVKLHPSFKLAEDKIKWDKIAALGLDPNNPITSLTQYTEMTIGNSAVHLNKTLQPDSAFKGLKSSDVLEAHKETFKYIHPWAGQLRKSNSMQFGSFTAPPSARLPLELAVLDKQAETLLAQAKTPYEKLQAVTFFHAKFIALHPFEDGNGRSSRTAMSSQIGKELDLSPVPFMKAVTKNKPDYIKALEAAIKSNNLAPLTNMLAEAYNMEIPSKQKPLPFPIKPSITAPAPKELNQATIQNEYKLQSNSIQSSYPEL